MKLRWKILFLLAHINYQQRNVLCCVLLCLKTNAFRQFGWWMWSKNMRAGTIADPNSVDSSPEHISIIGADTTGSIIITRADYKKKKKTAEASTFCFGLIDALEIKCHSLVSTIPTFFYISRNCFMIIALQHGECSWKHLEEIIFCLAHAFGSSQQLDTAAGYAVANRNVWLCWFIFNSDEKDIQISL